MHGDLPRFERGAQRQTALSLPSAVLLWLSWVLLSTIGATLGAIAAAAAATIIPAGAREGWVGASLLPYLYVVLVGAFVFLAQWTLVRRLFPLGRWWLAASIGGWTLGYLGLAVASFTAVAVAQGVQGWESTVRALSLRGSLAIVAYLALFGTYVGAGQWLFLRQFRERAAWWVLASTLGWALLGLVIGEAIVDRLQFVALGTVPAGSTGIALIWLLAQRPARPPNGQESP